MTKNSTIRTESLPERTSGKSTIGNGAKFIYLGLAITAALAIVYLSSVSSLSVAQPGSTLDSFLSNFAHIPAYGTLSYLWSRAFVCMGWDKRIINLNRYLIICLIAFAISDEVHQAFVPGRTSSFMDIGLDMLGISLGIFLEETLRKS